MNELISNFRLSNKVFALVLKDEKLISKDERLLEVTSPISISILLNLRGYNSYVTTDLDDKFYEYINLKGNGKYNFVYNGELCEDVRSAVEEMRDVSSFNIGICSNNPAEFALIKDSYCMFKEELEETYGIEINEVDKKLDDYETYVLSYKRK